MSGKAFVDTNIWVYAHLQQDDDPKWQHANDLVEAADRRYVISTQVLNEYYAVMLRNKANDMLIQANIEAMLAFCEVELLTIPVIRQAHQHRLRYGFLMISSALNAKCSVLYTEDLQHGQRIENTLTIRNPFKVAG
jgi:predicted nucleic acid-binding protein